MEVKGANDYKLRKSMKWIYVALPANVAMGPISTLITLYILTLGGSIVDVAYIITLGTAISIPASFFWGRISDIYRQRKLQIIISYLGLAGSLVGFYFVHTVAGVALFYAAFSFIIVAAQTPLNLLIIEHHPSKKWPALFSNLQMISGLGATFGFVIAAIITKFLPLSSLIELLFLIAIAAVIVAAKYVYEPSVKFANILLMTTPFMYLSRILFQPIMILIMPEIDFAKKLLSLGQKHRVQYKKAANPLKLMYFASFIFFLGAGFFNTAYPAGLNQIGLVQSDVFLILFFGIFVQTLTFRYAGAYIANKSKPKIMKSSLILRGAGYLLIGISFLVLRGFGLFLVNSLLYLLAAGLAYSIFYTASQTVLFKSISRSSKGSALGVYTAIMAVAGLAGALLSGYTSLYIGYWFTFSLSGVLVLVSAMLFEYLPE